MSRATEDIMAALHGALAEDLLKRIKEGTAAAADLSVARAFLKENGITAVVKPGTPLADLADAMEDAPFDEDDEIERQAAIFAGAAHGRA